MHCYLPPELTNTCLFFSVQLSVYAGSASMRWYLFTLLKWVRAERAVVGNFICDFIGSFLLQSTKDKHFILNSENYKERFKNVTAILCNAKLVRDVLRHVLGIWLISLFYYLSSSCFTHTDSYCSFWQKLSLSFTVL